MPNPGAAVPGAPAIRAAGTPPTPPVFVPGAPGVPSAAAVPGLPGLIPAAPIASAAGSLPTPPAGVIPGIAQGVATLLSPPQVTIPGIPGFGIPLPSTISGPHDLLCAASGWSASAAGPSGAPAGALLGADLPPGDRWFAAREEGR